jgi:hypothetical protein
MGVIQTWVTKNAEGTCFIMWILNFKTACLALFSKFRPHTKRSDLPPSILETMTVEWWLFGMEHLQNFANVFPTASCQLSDTFALTLALCQAERKYAAGEVLPPTDESRCFVVRVSFECQPLAI